MRTVRAHCLAENTIPPSCKALIVILLVFSFCSTISIAGQDELKVLPPPVVSSAFFPCSRCHEHNHVKPVDSEEATHSTISVAGHIENDHGCFDCHDSENREKLILFTGTRIEITVSSELCGQCHSTNYRLWSSGLHGKGVGNWNGPRQITPCTTCHDPHQPEYPAQKPAPPPTPPEKTLRWRR